MNKENKYITHNEMCPNRKIFVGGTYVFASGHYYMYMARVSIAFIGLLDFLNDFVLLSFVAVDWLGCSSYRFGLCNSLHGISLYCKHTRSEQIYLARVGFGLVQVNKLNTPRFYDPFSPVLCL